jgi:hypothetical protein
LSGGYSGVLGDGARVSPSLNGGNNRRIADSRPLPLVASLAASLVAD